MTACATCARALQPAWKFCIYCGARVAVPEVVVEPTIVEPVVAEAEAEPAIEVEPAAPADRSQAPVEIVDELTRGAPYLPEPDQVAAPRSRPMPRPLTSLPTDQILSLRAALAASVAPAAVSTEESEPEAEPDESIDDELFDDGPIDDGSPDDGSPDDDSTDDERPQSDPRDELPTSRPRRFGRRGKTPPAPVFSPAIATSAPHAPAASIGTLVADPHISVSDHDERADEYDEFEAWDDEPEDRTGKINSLAVIALLFGLVLSPLAAPAGYLALRQMRTSGERGTVLAWVAMVLGCIWLGAAIVFGISYLVTNG
ncbi:hypothetical protein BH11ACT3_BH11ACT3_14930 [soil metagenome]